MEETNLYKYHQQHQLGGGGEREATAAGDAHAATVAFASLQAARISVILSDPHSQTEVRAICWGLKLGRNGSGDFFFIFLFIYFCFVLFWRKQQQKPARGCLSWGPRRPSRTMFMSMPLV